MDRLTRQNSGPGGIAFSFDDSSKHSVARLASVESIEVKEGPVLFSEVDVNEVEASSGADSEGYLRRWLSLSDGVLRVYECVDAPGGSRRGAEQFSESVENVRSLRTAGASTGGGAAAGDSIAEAVRPDFSIRLVRNHMLRVWKVRVDTKEDAGDWLFFVMRAITVNKIRNTPGGSVRTTMFPPLKRPPSHFGLDHGFRRVPSNLGCAGGDGIASSLPHPSFLSRPDTAGTNSASVSPRDEESSDSSDSDIGGRVGSSVRSGSGDAYVAPFRRSGTSSSDVVFTSPRSSYIESCRPPNLSAESYWGGAGGPKFGVWSTQGVRSAMEDAHVALDDIAAAVSLSAADAELAGLPQFPSLLPPESPPTLEASGGGGSGSTTRFFAVFDGHAGRLAADYAAAAIPRAFVRHAEFSMLGGDLGLALRDSFLSVEKDLIDRIEDKLKSVEEEASISGKRLSVLRKPYACGTTALALAIRGEEIVVASLGDCRGVLATVPTASSSCGAGTRCSCSYHARDLNTEHTPRSEQERIYGAGGWLIEIKDCGWPNYKLLDSTHPWVVKKVKEKQEARVKYETHINGELGVSRALGDADYKGDRAKTYAWDWDSYVPSAAVAAGPRAVTHDLVLSEPQLERVTVSSTRACDQCPSFIILACDGLWEVLSSAEAVELVVMALRGEAPISTVAGEYERELALSHSSRASTQISWDRSPNAPTVAARQLVDMAVRLGSSDNVSAIIIIL